jgi:hypothetical protein
MLNPQLVLAMADYLKASEALADATDDLIEANAMKRQGLIGNTSQFEEVAAMRLRVYRQARRNWENLQ